MRLLLFLFLSLMSLCLSAQVKHTISGSVKAKATGESIIRATVIVTGKNMGVSTNDYGYYSLTLPDGHYRLVISAAGQQSQTIDVVLVADMQLSTQLEERRQLQN